MRPKIEIKGLDSFHRQLTDLQRKAKELEKPQDVPFKEIFTPAFISKHSRFSSLDELFENSGFKIESNEDFQAIPDEPWDEYIRASTTFTTWREMLNEAGKQWMARQLGL